MRRNAIIGCTAFLLSILTPLAIAAEPSAEGLEFFEKKIRPVLVESCYGCHSAKSEKLKGALYLDSLAGMLKGGESGMPAVVPGNLEKSQLIRAIRFNDDELLMPPKKRLSKEQVADFEAWVKMGAPDPRTETAVPLAENMAERTRKHWAFQPVVLPPVPQVKQKKWAKTPVDNFILAKLEEKKLKPSPLADKRTLLRRITFDLTGLPPKPEDFEAFEKDSSPDALAKAVDRLLASPQYGERWGRYWLDLARYADTKGYVFEEERRYPNSYTYRDWVIKALNDDLPYDQFLIAQIAADRIVKNDDKSDLAAMGFLTVGRRFLNQQADIIDDRIDVVTRGTMALTVGCARCHDHKFDPIPTTDYYSLYAVFASSKEPESPPIIGKALDANQTVAYEKEVAKRLDDIKQFKIKKYSEHLAKTNKPEARAQLIALAQETMGKSDRDARKAAEGKKLDTFGLAYFRHQLKAKKDPVALKDAEIKLTFDEAVALLGGDDDFFDGEDRRKMRDLQKKVDAIAVTHAGAPPRGMILEDLPTPVKQHVFKRGNPGSHGEVVPRAFLSVLSGEKREPFKNGSGRLELAQAIASKSNPLTARVLVNRVWLNHFGAGLVRTPSDFGLRTEPPSHPELLDYLASRFMNEGWSLKNLHRWIMLSATYQQRSDDVAESRAADPENILLWRTNRRRLDFEALRDSLLAVAGNLDPAMGGRPVELNDGTRRRTVYGFIDRQNLPGMFRAFDFASPDTHSPQRFVTTVPQQALFMMNSPFAVNQARSLVKRPEITGQKDEPARIKMVYALLFGREPDKDELKLGLEFLKSAGEPVAKAPPVAWQYGYGEFDEKSGRVKSFKALKHFVNNIAWQVNVTLPDTNLGWIMLHAGGGHPGNDGAHAAIRRWTAPRDGVISISAKLGHAEGKGNGVQARVVSSRHGSQGNWMAHKSETETKVERLEVKQGDTIDFVVDPRGDTSYDSFTWSPLIKQLEYTPPPGSGEMIEWNAASEFAGTPPKKESLTPWQKYAQVLLETNEFVFVD